MGNLSGKYDKHLLLLMCLFVSNPIKYLNSFQYVESSKDSGDVVRNFVGGLEALVNLLKSNEIKVQAAASQAVSVIARNDENLGIMSDHGVVQNLAKLAPTVCYLKINYLLHND